MDRMEKEALQVSKEIAVKFIETQRISPANFGEIFPSLHRVVLDTMLEGKNDSKKNRGQKETRNERTGAPAR